MLTRQIVGHVFIAMGVAFYAEMRGWSTDSNQFALCLCIIFCLCVLWTFLISAIYDSRPGPQRVQPTAQKTQPIGPRCPNCGDMFPEKTHIAGLYACSVCGREFVNGEKK